jgi:hypothetical protein
MINKDIFKGIPLSREVITKAVDFLGNYNEGQLLYPKVLLRNLNLSYGSELWITKVLVENELVDVMHYYDCPKCSRSTDLYTKTYIHYEQPICKECGTGMDVNDYKVIYRVKY